jgi:FMN phosphatase YigB (HAD superfamily)
VHNPRSYQQTVEGRAQAKAAGMVQLAAHFGTEDLVLFDDLPANVDAARAAGFRGQLVSREGCGISAGDLAVLDA